MVPPVVSKTTRGCGTGVTSDSLGFLVETWNTGCRIQPAWGRACRPRGAAARAGERCYIGDRPWLARSYFVLHPFLARPHALLADRLHDSQGPVLDLCTGTGLVAARVARHRPGAKVIGVDWDEAMIQHARRRWAALSNCAFVLADATRLPLDDASVPAVVCSLGLHEMPVESVPKALAEVRRILGPGGRLLVLDFHPCPGRPLSRGVLAVLTQL